MAQLITRRSIPIAVPLLLALLLARTGAARVLLQDTTPPTITVQPPPPADSDTSDTATVTWSPVVSDAVTPAGDIRVTCGDDTRAGGQAFEATLPVGSHLIKCTAVDAAGNAASATFTAVVLDKQPPAIAFELPMEPFEATSPAGAVVPLRRLAFVADSVDGAVTPRFLVAGKEINPDTYVFPIGGTYVTIAAADKAGNKVEYGDLVSVADRTPPALTIRTDAATGGPGVAATTPSAKGVVVRWNDALKCRAKDSVDASPVVTYAPASGTKFPVGVTAVTCTARDKSGNVGTATFTVTVTQRK
ncbi:hypothetical protein Rsub_06701 [Raphidocelis subcapitata]|uniref:HYR domain-containing protein n=1 Tax=Raphidocelis subcapitata TaxID=307507 RepID=A0A2V0P407_9CHLO|nr:hypothetical protein Rsub_06701 [Raphidocelis subcapitata]|eukprot:GBF94586.1 hypothetical protein Rsub_06701 [Raphidocelis subcapitata]